MFSRITGRRSRAGEINAATSSRDVSDWWRSYRPAVLGRCFSTYTFMPPMCKSRVSRTGGRAGRADRLKVEGAERRSDRTAMRPQNANLQRLRARAARLRPAAGRSHSPRLLGSGGRRPGRRPPPTVRITPAPAKISTTSAHRTATLPYSTTLITEQRTNSGTIPSHPPPRQLSLQPCPVSLQFQ